MSRNMLIFLLGLNAICVCLFFYTEFAYGPLSLDKESYVQLVIFQAIYIAVVFLSFRLGKKKRKND